MPECPHCHKNIDSLDHGVNCNLIFTARLNQGKFDPGLEDGMPLFPHTFDSLSEWFSCPECKGTIVFEAKIDSLNDNSLDEAAERFLRGVENYLEE